MVAFPQSSYLTIEEYLQREIASDTKHEYFDGEIFAMAGATDTHVTIAGNIFALLLTHLRGSGCRVYISDMKVKIEAKKRFFYPDVMVTCEAKDRENSTYKDCPCLIIEVLSDSTEAFDRGEKFADYQCLPSLQEYVLINTKKARIESFRRTDDGLWLLQFYELEQIDFKLASLEFTGKIDEVYQEVDFTPPIDSTNS
jgi:Uma2 family endonuclease